ncbi:hypothetical protein [Algoriphagus zhangzhouensis]|uniref:DoxX-like family protein n=1 Tax=Algoriphagus zhangzhouensis TaxID=1073327 RepID=A0A1M7ZCX5_9BACT|nr:hypothetical protein [Algoriphagus zhangzhouensis]TDY45687.1 hypothetical protein A8938_2289 [Algoriphagus zhangzhouensis]SHO62748.1 hypothetical protein SAMN04488108_2287 [Algoriphagus zhangzhouensis]
MDHQKKRVLILLLFLSTFFGYLEWGDDQSSFLIESELEIFSKGIKDPLSVLHPFTLIPFIGQILLLISLFQKAPKKWLVIAAIIGLGLLFGLILFIGIIGPNWKILVSSLPFWLFSILLIREFRKSFKS